MIPLHTKISSYSVAGSVEHSFLFYNLFTIKDGIIITPQLSLISGINKYVYEPHKQS